MAKAGEEETLQECDLNIKIYYRIVKKNEHSEHAYGEVNKSLERRYELQKALDREQHNLLVPS